MSTVTLTASDDGRAIDLRVGDSVVLRLAENPTTGYQWALEPGSDDVLTLQGSDYAGPTSSNVGGGGQRVFTFKAARAGSATVHLSLRRAWEGDQSARRAFTATFRARE
jgi:inhibitor of cysteine peptidase